MKMATGCRDMEEAVDYVGSWTRPVAAAALSHKPSAASA